jgi:hypothetical protein
MMEALKRSFSGAMASAEGEGKKNYVTSCII